VIYVTKLLNNVNPWLFLRLAHNRTHVVGTKRDSLQWQFSSCDIPVLARKKFCCGDNILTVPVPCCVCTALGSCPRYNTEMNVRLVCNRLRIVPVTDVLCVHTKKLRVPVTCTLVYEIELIEVCIQIKWPIKPDLILVSWHKTTRSISCPRVCARRLLMSVFTRVKCKRGQAFTYLGGDWLLLVDRCSKASQFLRRTKTKRSKHVEKLSEKDCW